MKRNEERAGRRYLAGSMAMALLVSTAAAGCSTQHDDPAVGKETNVSQGDVKNTDAPTTGSQGEQSVYLAQAPVVEALSANERAEIDLRSNGYASISDFTDDTLYALYNATMESGGENFLYSPTSLYLALSVLAECEDTEAAQELYTLLHVSDIGELTVLVNNLMASLISDGEGDICEIANSLWIADGFPWKEEASAVWNDLAQKFALDVFQMNLQSMEAGEQKNNWISGHTGGLLGNGEPKPWNEDVVMVIMNTVYFNKDWAYPFEAESTADKTFTKRDKTQVTCPMMYQEMREYGYLETEDYIASVLKYQDGSYMLMMLPDEEVLPEELLKSDLTDAVNAWREGKVKTADIVEFTVPKLDYSTSVAGIMEQMEALGISKAFKETAFYNLTDKKLNVSSILQDTRIQVDEMGTKAAAVTEILVDCAALPPECETVIELNLNRPYAYAIVSANGTILFSGVVNDPTAE